MLAFAAGIMLGGSIGAVIMGALIARVRELEATDRRFGVRPFAPQLAGLGAGPSTALH